MVEGSDSAKKLYLALGSNVSACGKDIPSVIHDKMNSWNVLTCREDGHVHDNTAVGGREADDMADSGQRV